MAGQALREALDELEINKPYRNNLACADSRGTNQHGPCQQSDKHIDISNVIKGHSGSAVEDGNRHTKHFSYNSTT